MSSAWDKWEKENNAFPVGQTADLHTKKKGTAKGAKTQKQADQAMQEQLAAAMIREIEYLSVIRLCQSALLQPASPQLVQRALESLKAVI